MYLLHTTELKIHHFVDHRSQKYCILSHTWGEEEVTFHDIQREDRSRKQGFKKIQKACELASREGHEYIWIDACCIDKSSSAELSEAINSMYMWYQTATCCYAYLIDFHRPGDKIDRFSFRRSRWFRRGWTLQELLAPREVTFYDRDWAYVGDKMSRKKDIILATGIEETFLVDNSELPRASVAARMSWAAHRQTTRLEDEAYCLMGLFDVNMPLLYGEGRKAFRRLQHEIARNIEDESLFAWHEPVLKSGIFAASPRSFAWSGDIYPLISPYHDRTPYTVTNRGLQFDAVYETLLSGRNGPLHVDIESTALRDKEFLLCSLNCSLNSYEDPFMIILTKRKRENSVTRLLPGQYIPSSMCFQGGNLLRETLYIKELEPPFDNSGRPDMSLSEILIPEGILVWYVTPPGYIESRPDRGRIMHFTCVPAFVVITIEDTNRISRVFVLEHAIAETGKYEILLQFLKGDISIMERINRWRRTFLNDLTNNVVYAPIFTAEQLGKRKNYVNTNRQNKSRKEYGLTIHQDGDDSWRLELLPPD
ncbi:MAG: hypothetical protein L6R41_006083 [Letrouitia leprolyta]|nr:MAG: hypothetical protein L6R41_006083 [Letrouitia leprolyta]